VTATSVPEYTVGEFSRKLALAFTKSEAFRRIAVIGEITDLKRWPDGNLSLSLKEGEAILSCFSFASETRSFPPLRQGLRVRAVGSIEIRSVRSIYQLRAVAISLVGEGELAAEIEELRVRLRAEGAFDASRKRSVPAFPRRVALVTSDDDARADFEGRLRADAPHLRVRFFASRVQGKGAEIDVADALDRASRANVDVIVLTRGGGSSDDRLTFNREAVVRAILRSRHPVVTALGHLKNLHLADEVADLALATPTAAAVHLGQAWRQARERINALEDTLQRDFRSIVADKTMRFMGVKLDVTISRFVDRRSLRLRELERRLDRQNPSARVAQWRIRFTGASARLSSWQSHGLDRWNRQLERATAALDAEDPSRPLARGYAIVSKDGVVVRDAALVAPGDLITARLTRGMLWARVESANPEVF
jgi:exodeoxyribonuclease VII large subunit